MKKGRKKNKSHSQDGIGSQSDVSQGSNSSQSLKKIEHKNGFLSKFGPSVSKEFDALLDGAMSSIPTNEVSAPVYLEGVINSFYQTKIEKIMNALERKRDKKQSNSNDGGALIPRSADWGKRMRVKIGLELEGLMMLVMMAKISQKRVEDEAKMAMWGNVDPADLNSGLEIAVGKVRSAMLKYSGQGEGVNLLNGAKGVVRNMRAKSGVLVCLLYTSDAADDM
jgi:hypothetical protein